MFPEFCAAEHSQQGLERWGAVQRYCLPLNKFVPYCTILSILKKTYSNNSVVNCGLWLVRSVFVFRKEALHFRNF